MNGNIESKTDAGNYEYDLIRKHAVNKVTSNPGTISVENQQIDYTKFNNVERIAELGYEMLFTYGADEQRKKVRLYQNGDLLWTRYYSGIYEEEIKGGVTRKIHYIEGGDGLAAICIKENGTYTMYYVIKDYLGSILALVNQSGQIAEEYSYDPWGRRRNPVTWSYTASIPTLIYRGFTSHEHYDELKLINMNARLYDPILGRMLSPDNYVQMPDNTQNLNRFTYCLNNPLVFADPDGEWIYFIASAIVNGMFTGALQSTYQYTLTTPQEQWNYKDMGEAAGKGAIYGGITSGVQTGFGLAS
ncbi:MAG: hypothetical protein HY738_09220, partial [Bacteroidia bacterium]|nr:hypothetical protein [Bacteroidia bacterium]